MMGSSEPLCSDFGTILGPEKELLGTQVGDSGMLESRKKTPKPVNAWNGKRVQVETHVSIFCKCPKKNC